MAEKIKIDDESGDRKYFTIIPNYILNHSTLWDREVYIQMKRIAGEDGVCWKSQTNLAKQCGIGVTRLKKSLKYLIEHGWIKSVGVRMVNTDGGPQEVNEYKIVDLWKINIQFYEDKDEGVSSKNTPMNKGVSRKKQRVGAEEAKGVSSDAYKEDHIKEDHINKIYTSFEDFWNIYPKKVGKQSSMKLWNFLSLEEKNKAIEDIPQRKNDDKWLGGFIKDPERYIKSKQWEDEIINKNGTHKKPDNFISAKEGKYERFA